MGELISVTCDVRLEVTAESPDSVLPLCEAWCLLYSQIPPAPALLRPDQKSDEFTTEACLIIPINPCAGISVSEPEAAAQ